MSDRSSRLRSQAFAWGSAAWPTLRLQARAFEQYLEQRELLATAIDRPRAHDLFLACACANHVPGAIGVFDQRFRALIESAAHAYDSSPSFGEEVRQELHAHLFVGREARAPRIMQYRGRGPLSGWVTTAAKRMALRMARPRTAQYLTPDAALVGHVSRDLDPELAWLRTRYQDVFNDALRIGFRQLSQRDRFILRLHVERGVSMARIAVMYKVTQPTISRWMRDAREQILRAAYDFVHEECDVDSQDLASLVRLVRSQLDLNLASLFQIDVASEY